MESSRTLTVVVVTYRSADVIERCLHALAVATKELDARIIVVDNASDDGTLDRARDSTVVHEQVLLPANLGYASGINVGSRLAPSGPLLVMNPDVLLEPLAAVAMLAQLGGDVGIVVPRLLTPDGDTARSLRRLPTAGRVWAESILGGTFSGRLGWGEVVHDPRAYLAAGDHEWATGAAWLLSEDCRRAVGEWDESFFLYSEETDYAERAARLGFRLRYTPEAVAQHVGGELMTSPLLWRIAVRNRCILHRRRHGPVGGAALRAGIVVGEALRAATGDRVHRAGFKEALTLPVRSPRVERVPPPERVERSYVCFSAQDWWYHNRAHSDAQLMTRLAEHGPVLLVNSIGMRMPLPGRSTRPLWRVLRKVRSIAHLVRRPLAHAPDFHVMTPLIVPAYGSRLGRALNAWLVRGQVQLVQRRLGLVRPVALVTVPTAWPVVERMDVSGLVVNRSDKYSEFRETPQHYIRDMEESLLAAADLVLFTSSELMREERPLVGGRAMLLDHGVDLDLFDRDRVSTEPAELAAIARPRIGFFGGIDDYVVDLDLLEAVALAAPDAQLVLIGDATCDMARLVSLPNVHHLSARPHKDIPAYGAGFDVALMPWLKNEWIRRCNPVKMKEYLALGLPTVSTDFPEARRYAEHIRIATTDEEFVQLVLEELAPGAAVDIQAQARRRAAVSGDSWSDKVEQLRKAIEEVAPSCAAS